MEHIINREQLEDDGTEPGYDIEPARSETLTRAKREAKTNADIEGWLTVDVYQTPDEIVVETAVAGIRPEDLDITATPDSLSIKGERRRDTHELGRDYLYQECYWGRFSRHIILPQEVDPESAVVHFENGILAIRLPKLTRKKPKKLEVRSS